MYKQNNYNYGEREVPMVYTKGAIVNTIGNSLPNAYMGTEETTFTDNGLQIGPAEEKMTNTSISTTEPKKTSRALRGIYTPYGYDRQTLQVISKETQDNNRQREIDAEQTKKIEQNAQDIFDLSFDAGSF